MKKAVSTVIILWAFLFCFTVCSLADAALAEETTGTEEQVIELEDDQVTEYIRNDPPREDGFWIQYYPLNTALRKNFVFSDVITPDSAWENYAGMPIETHVAQDETPENYDDSHNHYQNILSEVLNFKENANAVSIWGDSFAVVDRSKAWGGFFSARSGINTFGGDSPFSAYVPEGADMSYDPETYDTQLTGIEIDVLNDGLPGVYPNMSKTGLQIVGFGNPNSMAIEVRCEDTDKQITEGESRRGVWESGIYFKNSLAPYGRLIVTDFDQAKMGLDFRSTLFTEGAIDLRSEQVGTGIIYNNGNSGEIYGGKRWDGTDDPNDWLTLRMGTGGIRIVSQDNTKELVAIDNWGGVYLNGDLYWNGARLENAEQINFASSTGFNLSIAAVILCGVAILFMGYKQYHLSRKVKQLSVLVGTISKD